MFANFELSSGGLVEANVKPKRTRTDLGCLPCRRKKKKCGLEKPTCFRCRKSIGPVVCEWPAHASSYRTYPLPEEGKLERQSPSYGSGDGVAPPSSPSISESSTGTTLVRRYKSSNDGVSSPTSSCAEHVWSPPTPQTSIENAITIRLPAGVKKTAPRLSSSQLIQLTTIFDKAIISQDDRSIEQPASHLCLPLCLDHPGLMHAWLSCSTAFVAGRQPGGVQRALLHYHYAVKDLAAAIGGTGVASPEWKLATTLLLHTFESMNPTNGEDASIRIAHLNGAHNIVRLRMMDRPPSSMHELLLLEAYVYRTCTNRLFQPFPSLPYDHIERLYRTMCAPGSPRLDMVASWRKCPWVGMCAELFDMLFKLSWLQERLPLYGDDLVAALSLSNRLIRWKPPVETPEDPFDVDTRTADLFMMKNLLAAKAYWYTCLALSHKLLNPVTGPFDPDFRHLSCQGYKVLHQLSMMQSTSALVLLTVAILGLGAITLEEQTEFVTLTHSCAAKSGPGSIQRTIGFLHRAWAPDVSLEAGFLGSDILLKTDILRRTFL